MGSGGFQLVSDFLDSSAEVMKAASDFTLGPILTEASAEEPISLEVVASAMAQVSAERALIRLVTQETFQAHTLTILGA